MDKQLINLQLEEQEVVLIYFALIEMRAGYQKQSDKENEKQVQELRDLITKVQGYIVTKGNNE